MSAENEARAEAEAAADALLAEYGALIAAGRPDLLRLVVAMAWLKGWSDSGHTALRVMDAMRAGLS